MDSHIELGEPKNLSFRLTVTAEKCRLLVWLSCVYSYVHGYVAGERVYHVLDIFPEFLGHNFVPDLRTFKP